MRFIFTRELWTTLGQYFVFSMYASAITIPVGYGLGFLYKTILKRLSEKSQKTRKRIELFVLINFILTTLLVFLSGFFLFAFSFCCPPVPDRVLNTLLIEIFGLLSIFAFELIVITIYEIIVQIKKIV